MFDCEAAFFIHKKKNGQKEAVEYIADINRYTSLLSPSSGNMGAAQPSLDWMRTLFDRNEHFVELSNMGEADRSLEFLLGIILMSVPVLAIVFFAVGSIYFSEPRFYLYSIAFFLCQFL